MEKNRITIIMFIFEMFQYVNRLAKIHEKNNMPAQHAWP